MDVKIESSWKNLLHDEFEQGYFKSLTEFVKKEYAEHNIFPPASLIFNAFNTCPVEKVKVVILGQDPYHGPGQAHGLCFSVNDGIRFPPSLRNIFKELKNDLNIDIPLSGNLTKWAEQGVLLLNATLTVRNGIAGSHQKKGWETFTDNVIKKISSEGNNIVFILWGGYARKKKQFINLDKHHIVESAHPSPLSAHNGFWESKPFSKTNAYLKEKGLKTIDWNL